MSLAPEWLGVPSEVRRLTKFATPYAARLRAATWGLPRVRHHILLNPDVGDIQVHLGLDKDASEKDVALWEARFAKIGFALQATPLDVPPPGYGHRPWIWIKYASDPVVSAIATALNYKPNAVNKLIGGPSPLAATLTSGLLGAGLGYGAGSIAEHFTPADEYNPGAMPRKGALLGAAALATPALLWGLTAHKHHPETPGLRAWLSGWPFRDKDMDGKPYTAENSPIKAACVAARRLFPGLDRSKYLEKASWSPDQMARPAGTGIGMMSTMPLIPKDQFGRVIAADPYTPMQVRAAAMGLLDAAALANGNPEFVTPYDVAKISYNPQAGMVVGQTLGAMASLSPYAQQQLKNTGVWGALLSSVLPNAFPNPYAVFSPRYL